MIGKNSYHPIKVWLLGFLGLLLGTIKLQAQSPRVPELGAADQTPPVMDFLDLDPEYTFLYDAKTLGLDKENQRLSFSGDVILIGGGNVITADTIGIDYVKSELTAEGHVIFLHQNEIFTGEKVQVQWKTNDFQIVGAVLVANDSKKLEEVSRRILGQSIREFAYESARSQRLLEIAKQKDQLKRDFRLSPSEEPSTELLTSYERYLEQERLTKVSSAPSLADRDPDRRSRLERRRAYWQKSRVAAAADILPATYYFRLEGRTLERKDGNLYKAEIATFTPCHCEEDEIPAWSFHADTIEAQQEGYVDLKHPVLTIKGIPVLYLPFLKLPLKAKRQSGFLMPSFQTGAQKNGFVFTQPVFLDLAPNADATITTDLFQKRGTRLGIETRYEARRNSGFRYQNEVIRDNSWLQLGSQREEIIRYYLLEKPFCADPLANPNPDPLVRQTCEQKQVQDVLEAPGNSWRGKQEWQGRYSLAPRLSVVTNGKVLSDHRYFQDLYLPDDIASAFFANQANANAFSTAKARLNFDGQDFFAAIGGSYGDNALATERYVGQQIPAYFNVQTRLFRLLPSNLVPVPIYAEVQAKSISIDQWEGKKSALAATEIVDPQLGGGNWQRFASQLTVPLASQGIVRIDHFDEAELRVITHRGLPEQSSSIRSWRTGLSLNLPIDGQGSLPSWLRRSDDSEGTSYVHHIMNWGLSLSMRPSVVRDGLYGELVDKNNARIIYFPSDNKFLGDPDIREEDMMVPHQRFTLSTSHRWQVFDRTQEILPGARRDENLEKTEALQGMHEQALKELMSVKDQQPASVDAMFRESSDGNVEWYINRYRINDSNVIEPVSLTASMSFDNQQEKLRQEQIKRNNSLEDQALDTTDSVLADSLRGKKVSYYSLPEAWRGPYASLLLNWQGVGLSTTSIYNSYLKVNSSLSFVLSLPTVAKTALGMSYVLEKSPEPDPVSKSLFFKKVKTSNVTLSSGLIPYVSVGAKLVRKQIEQDRIQYGTSYQIAYDGISGCWGLRFVREKNLNQNEENASYFMQLAIIFLGNSRNVDVSPGIRREAGLTPKPR